ncbi:MAG TPA: acyltransferase family protein [Gemmatimonadaceae bacterium]|jgi:peptidoglycan/LPS O-acetylase OafA/YrhL|nr:acyltransferase family protein [Gemmatimonadaceae bacterium]
MPLAERRHDLSPDLRPPAAAIDPRRRPDATRGEGFRADIEGLRGIAVLLVVAYHAGIARVPGGFAGVDVFFVLSGYLITDILVRQVSTTGRVHYAQFYARRMRRLLPAATLTLVVVLAAAAVLLGPMERIEPALSAIAAALYSSNLFFLARAVDYFATAGDTNPFLHTWSLAVEEQFYLVWPWLVVVGWRIGRSRRGLGALLGAVSLASFALCVWLTWKRQPWAFFGTPARAWEFGLGGLATLLPPPRTAGARASWRWLGWLGLALVIGAALVLRVTMPFPGAVAMAPVLGTTLALIAGAVDGDGRGVGRLLGTRVLRWIGGRSYSWYLWHWPVLVFAAALRPAMPGWQRTLCALGALALAAATTALVENPIRFHPLLAARPRRSIVLGVLCTLVAAGAATAAYASAMARGGAYWHAAHDRSALERRGCTADVGETAPRECVFGDSAGPAVVLFGDSHAAQWFGALDAVAAQRHLRLVTLTKFSCPAARVAMYSRVLKRRYTECESWREAALRRIVALRPATVVIGQFSRRDAMQPTAGGGLDSLSPDGWRDGVRATLATLDSAGITTILLADTPAPRRTIPTCLSRAEHRGRPASVCAVPRARAVDSLAHRLDAEAASGFAHVRYLDLTDRICGPTTCEPIRAGVVVYRDNNHLTEAFVRTIGNGAF